MLISCPRLSPTLFKHNQGKIGGGVYIQLANPPYQQQHFKNGPKGMHTIIMATSTLPRQFIDTRYAEANMEQKILNKTIPSVCA